jgi:hypothetical protein
MKLRVIQAFGDYAVGDTIAGADAMTVFGSDNCAFVVQIADDTKPGSETAEPPAK